MVIGEEVKKIDNNLKEEYKGIFWLEILKLRNRIVYDYRSIDLNILFDIIKNYLFKLKLEFVKMFDKVLFESVFLIKIVNLN